MARIIFIITILLGTLGVSSSANAYYYGDYSQYDDNYYYNDYSYYSGYDDYYYSDYAGLNYIHTTPYSYDYNNYSNYSGVNYSFYTSPSSYQYPSPQTYSPSYGNYSRSEYDYIYENNYSKKYSHHRGFHNKKYRQHYLPYEYQYFPY